MSTIRRIMLATDFSPTARTALEYAAELSARLGAPLLIASCFHVPAYPILEGAVLPSGEAVADAVGKVSEALAAEKRTAIELGAVSVDTVAPEGVPATELVRLATDRAIDLIVMGTHGRTGLGRALLGSVADKLVRSAPCPVMVVHQSSRP